MSEQIFGWTASTPNTGQVGFVMLFKNDPEGRFASYDAPYLLAVREHGASSLENRTPTSPAHTPIDVQGLRELQHAISVELAAQGGSAAAEVHPAPVEFTEEEIRATPLLRYFHYSHLPAHLQERSAPFARMARLIVDTTPVNAERTVGLRKLLEAKDCIVRAALP